MGPQQEGGIKARLLRVGFIAKAIEDRADLSLFQGRPSSRLIVGLALIALSYLIGWPSMTALTAVAVWAGHPWWAVVGAPALYGISWGVWAVGMALTGVDSAKYGRAFGRWAIRRLAERFLVSEADPPRH